MARFNGLELRSIVTAIALGALVACGGPSRDIVGKWRTSDDANAVIWEFAGNGLVTIGTTRGRYTLQGDRVKVETPFGTSVYHFEMSNDQMTFRDSAGSQIRFSKSK